MSNPKKSGLRICFFGPAGSGKSTCFGFAEDAIHEHTHDVHRVIRADVAAPLHEAQWLVYLKMGMIPNDMMTKPEQMSQDGKLLSFLAKHFERNLGPMCAAYVDAMSGGRKGDTAFVNTDCRNNAYKSLRNAGFWFIRVKTDDKLIRTRLIERGDITPCDPWSDVENTNDIKPHFMIQNNGTKDELRKSVSHAVRTAILEREDFMTA